MEVGDRVLYKRDGTTRGTIVHKQKGKMYVLFDRFVLGKDGKHWQLMEVDQSDIERVRSNHSTD